VNERGCCVMNEKQAKKLRKLVYGDRALRGRDDYVARVHKHKERLVDIPGPEGLVLDLTPVTVMHRPGTDHANYHFMKRWAKGEVA
jgi:hypothetical protein